MQFVSNTCLLISIVLACRGLHRKQPARRDVRLEWFSVCLVAFKCRLSHINSEEICLKCGQRSQKYKYPSGDPRGVKVILHNWLYYKITYRLKVDHGYVRNVFINSHTHWYEKNHFIFEIPYKFCCKTNITVYRLFV